MGYTMKGSPAKLGNIQGTSGHRSALKQASALKQTDWAKMQAESTKLDPRYGKMTPEAYRAEVNRQVKHKAEYGTYDVMGTETKAREKKAADDAKEKKAADEKEQKYRDRKDKQFEQEIKDVESAVDERYPTRKAEIKKAAPDRAKYGIFTKEGRAAIRKQKEARKAKKARIKDEKKLSAAFEKDLKKRYKSGDITKEEYKGKKKTSRKAHKDYLRSEDSVRSKRDAKRKVKDAEKAKKKEKRAKELAAFEKV